MTTKRTVTHVDGRSSKDLRGPVIGLQLLRTQERTLLLSRQSYSIGSDRSCDIVVVNDPTVSALHCIVERQGKALYVFDQGSKNGTWVNDCPVSSSELGVRATLRVGERTTFLAYGPGIQDDDFATPSQDTFIRGQLANYGGNAKLAAQGVGVDRRTVSNRARSVDLVSLASAQRVTVFEDPIPVPIAKDPEIRSAPVVVGRRRRRRRGRSSGFVLGVPVVKVDGGK